MGTDAHDEVDRLRSEVDDLNAALASRDLIGQAKGILMERHGISAEEAFARLVGLSQTTNTKLRDVAARVARAELDRRRDGDRPDQRSRTTVD